jgi:hypothetical protein
MLAVAAAHGAVDLARPPAHWTVYILALLPVPSRVCTVAFGVASVVHFGADVSLPGSIVLHAAFAAASFLRDGAIAFDVVLDYMVAIHIPLLVARLALGMKLKALAILALSTLVAIKHIGALMDDSTFVLTDKHQLVVVAHVLLTVFL